MERRRKAEQADPVLFARRCGIEPDDWQADVLRSKARQLILNCSRQSGKSTVVALLALHQALNEPDSLILMLAPSWRQSQELFLKLKALFSAMGDDAGMVEAESGLKAEFSNGSRVISLPSSESTVRGYSAPKMVIVDEASRIPDALLMALRPMMAISKGGLVLLSTPFGKRGIFWQTWSEGGDDWHRVLVPATSCPRIDPEWLEGERRAIGELWFRSEYLCEFVDPVDAVFREQDIEAALTDDIKQVEWWNYETRL